MEIAVPGRVTTDSATQQPVTPEAGSQGVRRALKMLVITLCGLALWLLAGTMSVLLLQASVDPALVTTSFVLISMALAAAWTWRKAFKRTIEQRNGVRLLSGADAISLLIGSIAFGFAFADDALEATGTGRVLAVILTAAIAMAIALTLCVNQATFVATNLYDGPSRWLARLSDVLMTPVSTLSNLVAFFLAATALLPLLPENWPDYSLAACLTVLTVLMYLWGRFVYRKDLGKSATAGPACASTPTP